jgi:hypothetical protein
MMAGDRGMVADHRDAQNETGLFSFLTNTYASTVISVEAIYGFLLVAPGRPIR